MSAEGAALIVPALRASPQSTAEIPTLTDGAIECRSFGPAEPNGKWGTFRAFRTNFNCYGPLVSAARIFSDSPLAIACGYLTPVKFGTFPSIRR